MRLKVIWKSFVSNFYYHKIKLLWFELSEMTTSTN